MIAAGPAAPGTPGTAADLMKQGAERLQGEVDAPRREARRLLAEAMGVAESRLLSHPEARVGEGASKAFSAMLTRRAEGEPLSRILGRREFWSLDFRLAPETLDPRPDSETVVEAVLARLPDRTRKISILDFGTGTGCLLIALLSELPKAVGLGVDIVPAAVDCAAENARRLGIVDRADFRVSDWDGDISGQWDVIVSNPPYISEAEMAALEPAVSRYDPSHALAAGGDGLAAYRSLLPAIRRRLKTGGFAAVELGRGQAGDVGALAREADLDVVATADDLAGITRVAILEVGK